MSTRKRFVVEATWNGYTTSQCRVVHRSVETLFRAGYEAIKSHNFSDSTTLAVTVRDATPREKVAEIHGYAKLLRDAAMDEWQKLRKAVA